MKMASLPSSTFVVGLAAPARRQRNNTITKVWPNGRGVGALRVSCAAKAETVQKVCDIVRKQLALPADTLLTPESKFSALGADSLDTVEIVMGLEEEFGINVEEESSENITTVQEAADLIEKLVEKNASTA